MRPDGAIAIWFVGFTVGTIFYLALMVLIMYVWVGRTLEHTKLILLGLVTIVAALWYGGLPQAGGLPEVRELTVSLKEMVSAQGAPVLSRIGVILVLAGLANWLLGRSESASKPAGGTSHDS